MQYFSVLVWLISLTLGPYGSIHVIANGNICFFLRLNIYSVVYLCVCVVLCINVCVYVCIYMCSVASVMSNSVQPYEL